MRSSRRRGRRVLSPPNLGLRSRSRRGACRPPSSTLLLPISAGLVADRPSPLGTSRRLLRIDKSNRISCRVWCKYINTPWLPKTSALAVCAWPQCPKVLLPDLPPKMQPFAGHLHLPPRSNPRNHDRFTIPPANELLLALTRCTSPPTRSLHTTLQEGERQTSKEKMKSGPCCSRTTCSTRSPIRLHQPFANELLS